MINAVANSTVPHISLLAGVSYGAGNYGMSGRAYDPRFMFGWPNHKIAVMGPKQLAGVMSIIRRAAADSRGNPTTTNWTPPSGRRSRTRSQPRNSPISPPPASGTTD